MGNGNVIWPLVLEKAFAKMLGNYSHILDGKGYEAVRYLSGAPYVIKKNKDFTPEEIYRIIEEARIKNHSITAAPVKRFIRKGSRMDRWGFM